MLSRLVGKKIIRRRSSRLLVSIQCSCLCIMVCSGHWIPNHCKLGAMRVLNSSIQLPSASVAELYPGLARSNVTSSLVSLLKELNQTRMEEPDCFLGFLGDSLMSDTTLICNSFSSAPQVQCRIVKLTSWLHSAAAAPLPQMRRCAARTMRERWKQWRCPCRRRKFVNTCLPRARQ